MPTVEDSHPPRLTQMPLVEACETLAGEALCPGGMSAAAIAAALGLSMFEKSLKRPPHAQGRANSEIQVLSDTRKKLLTMADADAALAAELEAALHAPESEDREATINAARVAAYRSTRRLLDQLLVGLSIASPVVERGHEEVRADVLYAVQLLATTLEAIVRTSGEHLHSLDDAFAAPERPTLERQAEQARELIARAQGGLSWRGNE